MLGNREGYGEREKSYVEDSEVSNVYHARPAAPAILNQVDGRSPGKWIQSIRLHQKASRSENCTTRTGPDAHEIVPTLGLLMSLFGFAKLG